MGYSRWAFQGRLFKVGFSRWAFQGGLFKVGFSRWVFYVGFLRWVLRWFFWGVLRWDYYSRLFVGEGELFCF